MTPPAIDLRDPDLPAEAVRAALSLSPHPEGGWYRETWRDTPPDGGRGVATTIQFLLARGERSHWHRVDAAEIWCWQGGAPLRLGIARDGVVERVTLGPCPAEGHLQQAVVPVMAWQAAESLGAWSVVGCIVAPAFQFAGFELAPPGWAPEGA
ncbi:cupin domain-containing protein [Gluconacetobacter sacchari]|uniref:Cupin domain-containing protein n=2 Tax=Gluconacetobacter sacchari TaxID=92759 RepID=A0A7W4NN75_9PROT|nr:cupin domain-containing protein [Gluconacetobacter sacchari]MBB2160889.1 cupin domain-containing protein [Gluconacetobacter sacchari]GBQ32250.1 cupin superfamily protein [Gluconacetobacter sacchari DSM 12717]